MRQGDSSSARSRDRINSAETATVPGLVAGPELLAWPALGMDATRKPEPNIASSLVSSTQATAKQTADSGQTATQRRTFKNEVHGFRDSQRGQIAQLWIDREAARARRRQRL